MVDMDQTLIEAVSKDDPRYQKAWGDEISFRDREGMSTYKVHIRPGALEMVSQIKMNGKYIVWSAGVYHYVHAMMNYFNEKAKVLPDRIYTREDMVLYKGQRYKSMKSIGYENFIIIDDNEMLIHPDERGHIIRICSWVMESHTDQDLDWVSKLIRIYTQEIPILVNPKATRFRLTDLDS